MLFIQTMNSKQNLKHNNLEDSNLYLCNIIIKQFINFIYRFRK